MDKIIAAAVLVGILALNAVFCWGFPKAGIVVNGLSFGIGAAAIAFALAHPGGNAMEDSDSITMLMVLVAGIVVALIGGMGLGWALWLVRH